MTDDEWKAIEPLAIRGHAARVRWHSEQLRNTETEPRKALEQTLAFERARAEWLAAERALAKAMPLLRPEETP